jgi:hypothetical protein
LVVAGAAALVLIAVALFAMWPQLSGNLGVVPVPSPTTQVVSSTPATSQPEYELGGKFLEFWGRNGGLPVFGNPISDRMTEFDANGNQIEVQYFERARFELYPLEGGKEPEVTLGSLGTEVPVSGTVAFPLPEELSKDAVEFPETDISTPGTFYAFWERHGGAPVFGYPITPVLIDVTSEGREIAVQYFERARFEYHPEAQDPTQQVRLTNLGTLVYELKYGTGN